VSKAVYYRMRAEGLGPRTYRIGRREYISSEAAAAWQRQRKEAAVSNAGEMQP